jgi:hypothetical protein
MDGPMLPLIAENKSRFEEPRLPRLAISITTGAADMRSRRFRAAATDPCCQWISV